MRMISISFLSKVLMQKNDMTNKLLNTSTYAKYGSLFNKLPWLTSVSCECRLSLEKNVVIFKVSPSLKANVQKAKKYTEHCKDPKE